MRWIRDEQKAAANVSKHKVPFELAIQVFTDPFHLSELDPYEGEERWLQLASLCQVIHSCCLLFIPIVTAMAAALSAPVKPYPVKGEPMKMRSGDPLSPELLAQLECLEAMPDEAIDTSSMPEVTDWSNAVRGQFYRPIKKPYSLRLDADVVAWFKSGGDGYQTRINAALREYVLSHSNKSV